MGIKTTNPRVRGDFELFLLAPSLGAGKDVFRKSTLADVTGKQKFLTSKAPRLSAFKFGAFGMVES